MCEACATDLGDSLRPLLDAIGQGETERYEAGVTRVISNVTELARIYLAELGDKPVHEGVDGLAAKFMYELTHQQLARLMAEISIRFAQSAQGAALVEPDDDLGDVDPVTAAAVRLADEADEGDSAYARLVAAATTTPSADEVAGGVRLPGLYI